MKSIRLVLTNLINRAKKSPVAITFGILLFVFSSVITISSGITIIRSFYLDTIGYQTKLLKDFESLSAGANIDYYKQKFGAALFVSQKDKIGRVEYIFVNKYFYLQAITDKVGTVLAYSITTRYHNFNPVIKLGPYTIENKSLYIKLGKTRFSDLNKLGANDGIPDKIYGFVGAHNFFTESSIILETPEIIKAIILVQMNQDVTL